MLMLWSPYLPHSLCCSLTLALRHLLSLAMCAINRDDMMQHLDTFAVAMLPAFPDLMAAARTEPRVLSVLVTLPGPVARRGASVFVGKSVYCSSPCIPSL